MTVDYGRALEFGISVVPEAAALEEVRAAVGAADRSGLDLVGIQDHPYQRRFLDTLALIGTMLAETRRVRVFPDVANLPLRPPTTPGVRQVELFGAEVATKVRAEVTTRRG